MASKKQHHRSAQRVADQAATIRSKTQDAFVNMGARVGFGAGSQQDGSHYRIDFISRNPYNLEAAYRSNWVCGKVVDAFAEDMTREGIELMSDELKPDENEKLLKAFELHNIWGEMTDGIKWGRLYGGCVVVLLVEGQALNTPLRIETVGKGQFKGILALDRYQVNPSLQNPVTEIGPDLGKPKWYDVAPGSKALSGERIHYSRIIRIDGQTLPWRQALAENGWGQSVLERLWDRVIAFDSTTEGAAQLVYKAHLRTLKMKGFREAVALGGAAFKGIQAQLEMIRQWQSNEGLTVLDLNDEFETHTYTFAGLSDLMLQFGQQLSGATGIPLVRLFGQAPAGLNSTGESDFRQYYDEIAQQQDQRLRPGVGKILALLHRSLFGTDLPEGFAFEFVPPWQLTEEEKANVLEKKTNAVVTAYDAALISEQTALRELRQASRTTGVFTNITDEDINKADSEPPEPVETAPPTLPGLPGAAAKVDPQLEGA